MKKCKECGKALTKNQVQTLFPHHSQVRVMQTQLYKCTGPKGCGKIYYKTLKVKIAEEAEEVNEN